MAAGVLPPVKSVVVYRNGDPFYNGRRFVINQRQVATMEAFLTEVTQNIGAPLAIRTLYTPRQGHRVNHLQELQTGAQYVAAGFEKFKKLDYLNSGVKKPQPTQEDPETKVIQRRNVSAKWRKLIPLPCVLHVFRNGDILCSPFRFIIPRSLQQDLELILSLVSEKVSLRTGAVRRLCTLDGVTVTTAAELQTGHCYVAVGNERFKKLPYVELLASKKRYLDRIVKRRTLRGTEKRNPESGAEDQFSDSALPDSLEHGDGRRVKSTGDEAAADSVFFSRPVRIRQRPPRPPLAAPAAQRSVFKRGAGQKREELRGAQEVQEDHDTLTELPVDQRAAETVDEEEDLILSTLDTTHELQTSERVDEGATQHSARAEEATSALVHTDTHNCNALHKFSLTMDLQQEPKEEKSSAESVQRQNLVSQGESVREVVNYYLNSVRQLSLCSTGGSGGVQRTSHVTTADS
ncbi:doublecortin domain-containing protein 2B [Synchiropus splendidus]|uniref:doublecortin domain-containing protein 2B n=1 Tax=Synchiropus splendidus TaxID=270530 RepID=UPI00237EA24D|nr:doublecortin domain-containing protein 2B [Synchiropus splendidus]